MPFGIEVVYIISSREYSNSPANISPSVTKSKDAPVYTKSSLARGAFTKGLPLEITISSFSFSISL